MSESRNSSSDPEARDVICPHRPDNTKEQDNKMQVGEALS
jgi:hypothetical protein